MRLPSHLLIPAVLMTALPAKADPAFERFQAQVKAVRSAVDPWRANPENARRVYLVFGARTQEAERFEKNLLPGEPPRKVIYIDAGEHTPSPAPHIQMDFNNPDLMFSLSRVLAGRISFVGFDHSVVKFTRWNVGHLSCIRRLLEPMGTFYLPVETWGGLAFGMDPGHPPTLADGTAPTGNLAEDSRIFGELIRGAMWNVQRSLELKRKPGEPNVPALPVMLQVPLAWSRLDEVTRLGAIKHWKTASHIPKLQELARQAGFSSATPVKFIPFYLRDTKERADGIEYLACKP